MKVLVCYVIWNKHEMISWICSGIKKSFPNKEVDLYFLLDNPIDGTDQVFEEGGIQNLLPGYNVKFTTHYENPKKQFKFVLQNIGLQYGYENGYDWIICPQDDQKIEDPFLLKNLKEIQAYSNGEYHAGLIGGRDGFDELNFKNGYGSLFSHPIGEGYQYLLNGDFERCRYLNDGPLIYHRSVIEQVGYHDEEFKVFMSELDYCNRCAAKDLQNYVLGMSIVHEKFGTFRSNLYYDRHGYSKHDHDLFRTKWHI